MKLKKGPVLPEGDKQLSTKVVVEKLAEHDINEAVLSDIKGRKEGAL